MAFIGTSKSLLSGEYQIRPLLAEKYAWERYSITSSSQCVDPNQLTYDAYQRQAHPYSLTRTQGGECSQYDPATNLQAWINRENGNDRPWIAADLSGRQSYDTMGAGRNMTRSNIGWYHLNMPKQSTQCCDQNIPVHKTYNSQGRMNKAGTQVYNS
jgi:hypothetical protein